MKILAIGTLAVLLAIGTEAVVAQDDLEVRSHILFLGDGGMVRRCYGLIVAVGEEMPVRKKAMTAAYRAWIARVAFDYGGLYTDLANAENRTSACAPSSTTTMLRRVYFRCKIVAQPCLQPFDRFSDVDPVD